MPGTGRDERGAHEIGDGSALWIAVLGPLQLVVDGQPVPVPGTKRRATLAMLAMAAPRPIGTEQLVDAVWPGEAPQSGRAALQSHISRLRRHLGRHAHRLTSTEAGYRLDLESHELDARHFEASVRAARSAPDPQLACATLAEAMELWRGRALTDMAEVSPLTAWARSLTELWIDASDSLVELALAVGDVATAVAVAVEATEAEPLREPSAILLVRALAADGRPAEALRVAHTFRTRLGDETGLEPSPALGDIERAVASGQLAPSSAGGASPTASLPAVAIPAPLPTPATELLGRGAELAGLARLLDDERLVTVVGPGGVGKTHLAIEVARRAAARFDQVHLVRLAPILDHSAVVTVLESVLGMHAGVGLDDPVTRCAARLEPGRQLLVVDCCEHVLDGVRPLVGELLESCPQLTILATSRERLALPAEQTCRLAPLPMPASGDGGRTDRAPAQIPSVALFLDRARRARAGLESGELDLDAVSRIVRRLDGMPLAIELAASRLSSLGLADLESRLDRALDLLGTPSSASAGLGNGQDRHRTLRAAVEWSYDLLPPQERQLFRNLSLFPDGVDLPTAEVVAVELGLSVDPATALSHLADASMVEADLAGPSRYRMLDTLRAFGVDQLQAEGEREVATDRLVAWGRDLTTWLAATFLTDDEPKADQRLRAELANLRAAWRTARDRGDLDAACAMVVDLNDVVAWRDVTEVWGWARELADDPSLAGHPWECMALAVAAEATWFSTGDLDLAEALATRAMALCDDADERAAMTARWAMADVLMFRGQFAEARELALAARLGTPVEAEGYAMAVLVDTYRGELDAAADAAARCRQAPGPPTVRAFARYAEGELAGRRGDWAAAERAYRDALATAEITGARFLEGVTSVGLVSVLAPQGRVAEALEGYQDLIHRWERTGGWTQQWTTLRNLADLLETLRDVDSAEIIREAANRAPEASALRPGDVRRQHGTGDPVDRDQILSLARAAIDRARISLATR